MILFSTKAREFLGLFVICAHVVDKPIKEVENCGILQTFVD